MRPSPGVFLGMHGKPKNSQTVGTQPYLRCLARAISLPHSKRHSCNMNMQFYDHFGETHVHTRASYAFRPRRSSPGLFGRKVTEHTETWEASAQSTPVCMSCTLCSQFHAWKISKFLSRRVVASQFVHSLNTTPTYADSESRKRQSSRMSREGEMAPRASPAFAVNYPRNARENCKQSAFGPHLVNL